MNSMDPRQTFLRYMEALKALDWKQLEPVCTEKMYQHFRGIALIVFWLTRTIYPRRWKELSPQNFHVESVGESRAVVSYSLDWGRRHFYERVVLLKQNGHWKVDGRFM